MTSQQVEKLLYTYRSIAQTPSITAAKILEVTSNGISLDSTWTERNLERQAKQKFLRSYFLSPAFDVVVKSFPVDVSSELLSATTEDQEKKAILRQATVETATKQFIEIWDQRGLVKSYDLAALDVHGDVYTDSEFRSFEWSPDKIRLLYIAEKKLPKSEPFYKQKSASENEGRREEDAPRRGNEYLYKPHWGEQLVGKHRPVIAILDTTTDSISIVKAVPDELSPGQVLWTPDGEGIVGVAWKHEPRHLGLMFCTNRLSWIFLIQNEEYRNLSSDGCAVHSPRFAPDGNYLVWLEREAGGPHHNAHRLMRIEFETEKKEIDTLINITERGETINNGKQFYGLYGRLPQRCWSKNCRYLFFNTQQQSNIRSYVLDTKTKVLTEINNDTSSLSILDVKDDVIAFYKTSVIEPSSLLIGRFTERTANDGDILRTEITKPGKVPGIENVMYENVQYDYDSVENIKHFNYTYIGPKNGEEKSVPLIVAPHGGPHSSFSNVFPLDHTLFVLSGFAVLQVNYRGSIGMGSANVEYLQGKVGDADVKDCVTATMEAVKRYPWLDPRSIGLCGGSHGGFLVTHLSGQHTDLYKAVVTRNPVIDISTMFTVSDIPDCRNTLTRNEKSFYHHDVCAAETNQVYVESLPPGTAKPNYVDMCRTMLKCSPIMHVDKVKAPTLLCIGTNDLRVPPSQGKLWYQRLKANGVKTKLLVYEDNHQLGSGTAEIDSDINACLWFFEHCLKSVA